ncbi:MAG TPA: chromosome segregation protein SMC, partial [Rhodanobacteraceae bacterium]|nr:chromosome segregation protein SMC [Rhodanobacteraceae bacterium]
MRLTSIKMAGFKSFVDPTTLHLPTNLSGVVGPNGCGKSNIIDAVRWVMGESAASRLRGDSLTDVIFAGSSARKPVGQATVELLFDNADATITGEYAQYAEISVKRTVSRDGSSQYYLNGSRCRRRDITDLFLGTGLGPRSYSIIEQGIISDIVEAAPEQLRAHLEEAAGISRYKERRKETESRIRQTRENLERINDIRDEVEKQLEHLNRQARAAERWTLLKEELKRREAELHALGYRATRMALAEQGSGLADLSTAIEQKLAGQRHVEAAIEECREAHHGAGAHLNQVQGEVYRIGAEIARVEQQERHNRELKERLERAHGESSQAHEELGRQAAADRNQLQTLRNELAAGEPQGEALRIAEESAQATLQDAESRLAEWQQQWQQHGEATAAAARAAEVERTHIDHLDKQALELGKRREALEAEQQATDMDALSARGEQLTDDHESQQMAVEQAAALLDQRKQAHEQVLADERTLNDENHQLRQRLQAGRGRLASLEALQAAALGQDQGELASWLQAAGIDPARRLGNVLDVDSGWETAVETVLSGMLEGVLDDAPHAHAAALAAAGAVDLTLLSTRSGDAGAADTLAAHARGPAAALALLSRVRCAEDVATAQRLSDSLAPGDSVITPDGTWFGPGYVRVLRAQDRQAGVLSREREIQQLGQAIASDESRLDELSARIDGVRGAKIDAEQAREDAQRQAYQAHRRLSELAGELQSHRGKLETTQARVERLVSELADLAPRLADIEQQASNARARLHTAVTAMGDCEGRRQTLEAQRRELLEQREEARLNARDAADATHRLALTLESRRSSLASLEQNLERSDRQLSQLAARRDDLARQLAADDHPVADLERERQTYLDQRLLMDRQLVEARRTLEHHEASLREHEQERQRFEQAAAQLREEHAERRLSEQALRLEAERLAHSIAEAGLDAEALLAELDDDVDPSEWQGQIEGLRQKIQRLEPVNLAAIQEHAEQAERKTYLDAQMNDLTSALETLETAIRKIDRETRSRFKETFEKVNIGLQELFPRLFGGGHAYLELTGEDLLDAGVAIMVRPPGKRISNISLLSGGEKAVTAIALVFAIF